MTTYLPTSYDNLKLIVQEIAENDSIEFIEYIPTAVYLAEERLYRLVDFDFSKESTSLSTSDGVNTLTKPTDFRTLHNIYVTSNSELIRLTFKTESFIRDYWPNPAEEGVPKYIANKDANTWILAPTPSAAFPVTVAYEARPEHLSDSVQTNIYITKFPDLLLYATLSAAAEWMRDSEFKAEWENKLQEALQTTNIEGVRERRDDNAHIYNPEGGLNTKG